MSVVPSTCAYTYVCISIGVRSVLNEPFISYKDIQPGDIVTVSNTNCTFSSFDAICNAIPLITGDSVEPRLIWNGSTSQPFHSRTLSHSSPCRLQAETPGEEMGERVRSEM